MLHVVEKVDESSRAADAVVAVTNAKRQRQFEQFTVNLQEKVLVLTAAVMVVVAWLDRRNVTFV